MTRLFMQDILFKCPHCFKGLHAIAEMAGIKKQCLWCKAELVIPHKITMNDESKSQNKEDHLRQWQLQEWERVLENKVDFTESLQSKKPKEDEKRVHQWMRRDSVTQIETGKSIRKRHIPIKKGSYTFDRILSCIRAAKLARKHAARGIPSRAQVKRISSAAKKQRLKLAAAPWALEGGAVETKRRKH